MTAGAFGAEGFEVYSGSDEFLLRILREGGAFASCSNGSRVMLDGGLEDGNRGDTVLVCGGVDVARAASRPDSG